jgi:hypothetical protein
MKDLYLPVAEQTRQRRGVAAAFGRPAARSVQVCPSVQPWLQPASELESTILPMQRKASFY